MPYPSINGRSEAQLISPGHGLQEGDKFVLIQTGEVKVEEGKTIMVLDDPNKWELKG